MRLRLPAGSTMSEVISVSSECYQHNDCTTPTGCDFGYSSQWRICSAEVINLGNSWEMTYGRDPATGKKEPGLFLRYEAHGTVNGVL